MLQGFLDNDLYKFTMQQAVWRLFPGHEVEYSLVSRGRSYRVDPAFSLVFGRELEDMAGLRASPDDPDWLRGLGCFQADYLDLLTGFRFDPGQVAWSVDAEGRLSVSIRGRWEDTILWEVPLLALISELYFAYMEPSSHDHLEDWRARSCRKGRALLRAGCHFADFGTRRRYSSRHQEVMIESMLEVAAEGDYPGSFTGTSNVALARKYGLRPVGTVAHEWVMAHEAMFGIEKANRRAMREWLRLYPGEAAIALSDTYTTRNFLQAFDAELARDYAGIRQDSGVPEQFFDSVYRHYIDLGVDPAGKRVIFSDGLDEHAAIRIHRHVHGRMQDAYGIGTHLTNDIPGIQPLDIVIKMTRFDGEPVVKLSDEPGKETGDPDKCRRIREAVGLD